MDVGGFQQFLRVTAEAAAKPVLDVNPNLQDEFLARVNHSWAPHEQTPCQACVAIATTALASKSLDQLRFGLDVIVDGPNVTETFKQDTKVVGATLLDILRLVEYSLQMFGARVVWCGPRGWCTELKQQAAAAKVELAPHCLIEAPGSKDDAVIIDWAVENDAFIVTNDRYLEHKHRFPEEHRQEQSNRYLMKFAWTPNPGGEGWTFAVPDSDAMKVFSARAPCRRVRRTAASAAPSLVSQPVAPPVPLPVAPLQPRSLGMTTISYPASNTDAGRIIGRGGGMIQALHAAHTGVKFYVSGDKNDAMRQVVFTGTAEDIERARADLVHRLSA